MFRKNVNSTIKNDNNQINDQIENNNLHNNIEKKEMENTGVNKVNETNKIKDKENLTFNQSIKYPKPTLISCNIVLKSYAQKGDIKNTILFFNSLKSVYGFQPDGFSWFNLIQASVTANDLQYSLEILDDWILSVRGGTDTESVSPNHIFNHIMSAFSKLGAHTEVTKLYEKMIENKFIINGHTYTTLITSAYENNDIELGNKYFNMILNNNIEINHVTWRVITAPFGRRLDYIGLENCMNLMRKSKLKINVSNWRDLIGIYCKNGLCNLALNSLKKMEEIDHIKPDFSCFLRVIRGYCESYNDWEKGLLLLRQSRELNMVITPSVWQYIIEAAIKSTAQNHGNRFKFLNQNQSYYLNGNGKVNGNGDIRNINKLNNNLNNTLNNNNNDNGFNKNIIDTNNNHDNNDNLDDNSISNNIKNIKDMRRNSRISCVFSLLEEMQTIDKIFPDSLLWSTVVRAFSEKIHLNGNKLYSNIDSNIDNNYENNYINNYNSNENNYENNIDNNYENDFNNNFDTSYHNNTYTSNAITNKKYFNYLFDNNGKYQITQEIALLERFLLLCTENNRENVFTELLKPLLRASVSVGTYVTLF